MARYNSSIPYDFPIEYDSADTVIVIGTTNFDLTTDAPEVSSGVSVGVDDEFPAKSFILTAFAPLIVIGARVGVPHTHFGITSGAGLFIVEVVQFSGEPIPAAHMEDAQKLNADAYVELFQIHLSDKQSKVYLKINKDQSWQGHDYEGTGIKLEGVGTYSSEEVARPKLSIINPEGIYSSLVNEGLLDNARIVRYRVLKDDVDNDRPIYRVQQWRVSRIVTLTKGAIVVELRDLMDGQNFKVPYRMFMPPEFATVSI